MPTAKALWPGSGTRCTDELSAGYYTAHTRLGVCNDLVIDDIKPPLPGAKWPAQPILRGVGRGTRNVWIKRISCGLRRLDEIVTGKSERVALGRGRNYGPIAQASGYQGTSAGLRN